MYYSLWCNETTMQPAGSLEAEFLRFQATGQLPRGCIIPQAVTHSLALMKMGVIIARNMLSFLELLIEPLLLRLVGVCIIFIPYLEVTLSTLCTEIFSASSEAANIN